MKPFFIIVLTLFSLFGYSQKLPDNSEDFPDGILIHYFDYSNQKNRIHTEVFLGEKSKFKLQDRINYDRIDISDKSEEIQTIETSFTLKFIKELEQCCNKKKCPDTFKGYYLFLKKGKEIHSLTIDTDFTEEALCGNELLKKIIDSFQKL